MINASTWDGKSYKPVGKLGLTLMANDNQAYMVLFKSKTQVLSRTDLKVEQMKKSIASMAVMPNFKARLTNTSTPSAEKLSSKSAGNNIFSEI